MAPEIRDAANGLDLGQRQAVGRPLERAAKVLENFDGRPAIEWDDDQIPGRSVLRGISDPFPVRGNSRQPGALLESDRLPSFDGDLHQRERSAAISGNIDHPFPVRRKAWMKIIIPTRQLQGITAVTVN